MAKCQALKTELGLNVSFATYKLWNIGPFNLSECQILHEESGSDSNSYLSLFSGLNVFYAGCVYQMPPGLKG